MVVGAVHAPTAKKKILVINDKKEVKTSTDSYDVKLERKGHWMFQLLFFVREGMPSNSDSLPILILFFDSRKSHLCPRKDLFYVGICYSF